MMMKLLILSMALILLAGCSTPQSRAREHSELMAALSAEEREQVESGEVDLGFTEEMVVVALGEPDRKYTQRTAEGESVVWAYHKRGFSGLSVGVGAGIGGGRRGSGVGGGVSVGTGGRRASEESMRVIFEEGQVVGIERAD